MSHFNIVEITAKDNVVHQGMFHAPVKKGATAFLWIHGLTSNFYGDCVLFEHIIKKAEPHGIGFASFNTRGHDMITGVNRVDSESPTGFSHARAGAGEEVFTDCIFDIDAGITYLHKQGFKKVVLIGHSTGANKACYYAGTKKDSRVAGVILAGPISDRLGEEKLNKKLATNLRKMQRMIEKGKGDYILNNLTFFPITPKRYVSLFGKGSPEDVFDYGSKKPDMGIYSKITKPLLVVLSGNDEYADRPADGIRRVFDTYTCSKKYRSVIIENATHGYEGSEDEFANAVVDWVKTLKYA